MFVGSIYFSAPHRDESARVAVIDDTLELRRLVLGPREYLMSYSHDELISQQAITRYRIAHSFPVDKEASFSDIAAATGLDQGLVRRFLRHAIAKDILSEPRPGIVVHNAVSRLLAEDQAVHDWVGASTDDLWQAAAQTCNALDKWPSSQEPNETSPERARRFGNAMRAFTEGTGFELSHIVNNFPWGDFKDGIVVDVGGSQGFASFAIARQFPLLSCVVQDLEPVISAAEKDIPADLTGRVKFMTHDFFTEQPVVGADAYFFRWIFHNWSDKYSIEILRKHVPALKPGAKIVINDKILPQPGVLSRWQEDRLRSMDLTMTEIQNSYEREVDDWAKLFMGADPRFEFKGAKQPAGSNLGFVVAEWKGGE
ncbi:S-adenosyl-L-methionine-dependent methyltransferase [Xylaria sp. FL0064]|nr:S-adenosyl-L-methionine-dependent methyltransferase [Xylaria sp. FL0064]